MKVCIFWKFGSAKFRMIIIFFFKLNYSRNSYLYLEKFEGLTKFKNWKPLDKNSMVTWLNFIIKRVQLKEYLIWK